MSKSPRVTPTPAPQCAMTGPQEPRPKSQLHLRRLHGLGHLSSIRSWLRAPIESTGCDRSHSPGGRWPGRHRPPGVCRSSFLSSRCVCRPMAWKETRRLSASSRHAGAYSTSTARQSAATAAREDVWDEQQGEQGARTRDRGLTLVARDHPIDGLIAAAWLPVVDEFRRRAHLLSEHENAENDNQDDEREGCCELQGDALQEDRDRANRG